MSWQAKGGGWSGGGGPRGGRGGGGGFGPGFTPFGKKLAIFLFACLVVEMILTYRAGLSWLVQELLLYPINASSWRPWQLVTHAFVGGYAPLNFFFVLLGLFFFTAPVEHYFGTGRFMTFIGVVIVGSGLVGSLLSYFVVPHTQGGIPVSPTEFPFGGFEVVIIACLCAFGWLHRDATILLMFILPIPAIYIVYLTLGGEVLAFISGQYRAVYHLAGIGITYAVVERGVRLPDARRWMLLRKEKRLKKKLGKFEVIQGGKSGGRSNGHGDDEPPKPLLH